MPSLKPKPLLDGDSAKDDAVAYTDGPPFLFLLFLLLVALLLLFPLLPLSHRHPLFFFRYLVCLHFVDPFLKTFFKHTFDRHSERKSH